jgi:hypothetical protein
MAETLIPPARNTEFGPCVVVLQSGQCIRWACGAGYEGMPFQCSLRILQDIYIAITYYVQPPRPMLVGA